MPAYILRRRDNSKNGVEQMCKISGIQPDNNATWIWKFQILEDFWWASAIGSRDAVVQISLLRGRCNQGQSSSKIDHRWRYWKLQYSLFQKSDLFHWIMFSFAFCLKYYLQMNDKCKNLNHFDCRICHISINKICSIAVSQTLSK